MVKNCQNFHKWSKLTKMVKIAKNGPKGSKMVHNGPKWSKLVKHGKNGLKWSKMVQNGQNCKKNGGPDLKRARRTGLNARRTKSRGPKGFQLEVGPRSGPRLPVHP